MKYTITESKLRDLIREAVNEATSTPTRQTNRNIERIECGKLTNQESDDYEIEKMAEIDEALRSMMDVLYSVNAQNRYAQKISEHATIMERLLKRWKSQLSMKQGEQPDPWYYTNHEKPRKPNRMEYYDAHNKEPWFTYGY